MKWVLQNILFSLLFMFAFAWETAFSQDTILARVESVASPAEGLYIDGVELGKKLGEKLSVSAGFEILKIGRSAWNVNSKWVSVGDTAFPLQSAVKNKVGDKVSFWLPLPSALNALSKATGKMLELDSAKRVGNMQRIILKPLKDLYNVKFEQRENGELIELSLSKDLKAESFYMQPNFILRLGGAVIDSGMFADIVKQSAMINRVIPIQDKGSAQITLTLKSNCEGAELVKKDGGKTLQIVLRKKAAALRAPDAKDGASGAVGAAKTEASAKKGETKSASANANGNAVGASITPKKIKTIVIDPGHGGKDPGAIGYKNLQEKAVVLAVSLKLKKKLEDRGFVVKMTRSTDTFVELAKRPKMASDWGGDLFISMHCNAVAGKERQKKTEGFKFYILREGKSDEDKAVARRENQAIVLESGKKGKDEISPVEWIVLENQLNLYARESERLAGNLIENFDGGKIKKQQSGAGQAGFMVLVGAYMPAVLAELGFITNPHDGEYMGSEKGQNDLAERLAKSISAFAK